MANRIMELINLIEDEIDRSPRQRLSGGNKRLIDCDRLLDLLGDMKVVVPEEVRQSQAILSERDAILQDAESEATALVARARVEAERILANDKTIATARSRAADILSKAEGNASTVMQNARDYSQTVMEEVQRYLQKYMDQIDTTREELRRNYRPVETNYKEPAVYQKRSPEPYPSYSEESYSYSQDGIDATDAVVQDSNEIEEKSEYGSHDEYELTENSENALYADSLNDAKFAYSQTAYEHEKMKEEADSPPYSDDEDLM